MIPLMLRALKSTVIKGLFLTLLCLPGIGMQTQAVEVADLFQATITVNSRESQQERRRAFQEAMLEVLAKVSGSTQNTNPATIRRALNNPEPYVASWSTQAYNLPLDPTDPAAGSREVIEIVVNFYETEIQRLLDENNIPVWPGNRPETLVWVVEQDELGDRVMLGSSDLAGSELLGRMREIADGRGLPLLFPLVDLEDQLRLNANRLWDMDEAAILNASRRYQAESILAIRIYRSLSGEVAAKSLYFFRENVFTYEQFELTETEFLQGSINLATSELSQYYAVLLSGTDDSVTVSMRVDGIDSPSDYAALLEYLNTLEGVSSFQLNQVDQESLLLDLQTGGQLRQLVETMALEPSLQAVEELNRNGDEVSVHYRWMRN